MTYFEYVDNLVKLLEYEGYIPINRCSDINVEELKQATEKYFYSRYFDESRFLGFYYTSDPHYEKNELETFIRSCTDFNSLATHMAFEDLDVDTLPYIKLADEIILAKAKELVNYKE